MSEINCSKVESMIAEQEDVALSQRVPFVVHTGTVVCLISVCSNMILLRILSQSLKISPRPVYLRLLAVLDITMALNYIVLISGGVAKTYYKWYWMHKLWMLLLRPLLSLGKMTQLSQTYLIVAATVERYVTIVKGSNAVPKESNRRLVMIVCLMLCCILFHMISFWDLALRYNTHCKGFASIVMEFGELRSNPIYIFHRLHVGPIVETLLPFCLLVILNVLIVERHVCELNRKAIGDDLSIAADSMVQMSIPKKSEQFRALEARKLHRFQMTSLWTGIERRRLKDATNTTISIITSYLLANLPNVVITILELKKSSLLHNVLHYNIASDISSFLTVLSGATRLLGYVWANHTVRIAASNLLCPYNFRFADHNKYKTTLELVSTMSVRHSNERKTNYTVVHSSECSSTKELGLNSPVDL